MPQSYSSDDEAIAMAKPIPKLRVVRGADAVRELIASLYQKGRPMPECAYGVSNMDMLERVFPEYVVSSANTARLAAGVHSRFIYTSVNGPVYGRSDHLFNRDSRFLPPERLDDCGDITIVGDTVVFISEQAGDVEARAIAEPALAGQMRGVFEVLWACAT